MAQHTHQSNGKSGRHAASSAPLPPFGLAFAPDMTRSLPTFNPMLMTWSAWSSRLGSTMASMGGEWFSFLDKRLQEDARVCEQLAACGDAEEAWRLLTSHYQKAFEDYRDEAVTLSRIGSGIAGANVETVYKCFDYAGRAGRPAPPSA